MEGLSPQQIAEWFKEHKATMHEKAKVGNWEMECLRWQRPGSWTYGIDYLLKNNTLIVTGDLGDAVYCWSGPFEGLEWIAGLSIDYFHGKCEASELGRNMRNYEWDAEVARKNIHQRFKENRDCKGYNDFFHEQECLDSADALNEWCQINDPAAVFKDDDWWEWLPQCGRIMPIRTRAHLIGLKIMFGKELKYC